MELRRQQRVAEHCFHRGVSFTSRGSLQFFVRGSGADSCSCVSPSLLLQHRPKVASWTQTIIHPFPFLSGLAQSLAAAWDEGGHRKPPEQPRAPHPRGQQSTRITPLPRCIASAAAKSSSSRARAALMLELAPLLLPGSSTGSPFPAFLWRQCLQLGESLIPEGKHPWPAAWGLGASPSEIQLA